MRFPLIHQWLNVEPLASEITGPTGIFRVGVIGSIDQNPSRPFITYQTISDVEDANLRNYSCSARYTMQLNISAGSLTKARDLYVMVKRLLRSKGYQVYRDESYDSTLKIHTVTLRYDFIVNPN